MTLAARRVTVVGDRGVAHPVEGVTPTRSILVSSVSSVSSASFAVLARYESLEEFVRDADSGALPSEAEGGWVCVHPREFPEPDLARYFSARRRVRALGWRLVVSSGVAPHAVELRRHRRGERPASAPAITPLGGSVTT